MKKTIIGLLVLSGVIFADKIQAQQIVKTVNYDQLAPVLHRQDSVLYVVNFWATWCAPCVKELPEIMEVNQGLRGRPNYKMILISLDNAAQMDSKVKPFLLKNNITPDVYLLDDNKRMNYWINELAPDWSGTLPATVLIRNSKVLFFKENQITKDELEQAIVKFL